MLKVAIVGVGNIGKTHARVYQEHADTEIVAVCDLIEETAKAGGELLGVPYFTSVPDLLASNLEVDMASVCTAGKENGGDHYEPTMALLGGGIPVLGKNPFPMNYPRPEKWLR